MLSLVFALVACSSTPERGGYSRSSGGYSKAKSTERKTTKNSGSVSRGGQKGAAATAELSGKSKWEEAAKPWLGTPYKYGGTTKAGVDCSGFVMQLYKQVLGKDMPHNAAKMYKLGKKVSKPREGDLVFFGSFWDIDHVGIYLEGDRFVHSSSSKGVTVSKMDDVYWSKRYQGARRYE